MSAHSKKKPTQNQSQFIPAPPPQKKTPKGKKNPQPCLASKWKGVKIIEPGKMIKL